MLTVAAASEALTYAEVAELTGQSYSAISIQLALLSDGRGKQRGMDLLCRVPGVDRKQKKVTLSAAGRDLATKFLLEKSSAENFNKLSKTALPALRQVLGVATDLAFGTFCVLLYAVEHNPGFGLEGMPSVEISKKLGISNLPRHLAHLSTGSATRKGLGLVEMISDRGEDKRVVVPSLTDSGVTLMANVAATLQQKKPSPVKKPKPERLADDATQDDVARFREEDFDFIDIEWITDDIGEQARGAEGG